MSITTSNNAISSDNNNNTNNKQLLLTKINRNRISLNDYTEDEDEDDEEDLQMKKFQVEQTTSSSSSSSSSSFTSALSLSPKNDSNNNNNNNYIRYTYFDSNDRQLKQAQQENLKTDQSLLVNIDYLAYNSNETTNDIESQRLSVDSTASSNTSTSCSSLTTTTNLTDPINEDSNLTSTNNIPQSSSSPVVVVVGLTDKFIPIKLNTNEEDDLIESSIKNEEFDLNNQRIEHLFTPDSLESVSSSCSSSTPSLSEDLDNDEIPVGVINTQEDQKNNNNNNINVLNLISKLEDVPHIEHVKTIEINNEILEQKEFELNEKQILEEENEEEAEVIIEEDDDDEIEEDYLVNGTNDTSLILEKIRKINKLQEKINDINNKIKTIDMNGNPISAEGTTSASTTNQTTSYYCLNQGISFDLDQEDEQQQEQKSNLVNNEQDGINCYVNPNYCDDDDDDDDDDEDENSQAEDNEENERLNYMKRQMLKNSNNTDYRSLNNQTRLGNYDCDDEDDDDDDEDDDDDYDDDDEDDIGGFYKHAQPVVLGKKYASTGLLFHRYGGYLAPIEENDLEYNLDSSLSSSSSSKSSSISSLNQSLPQQIQLHPTVETCNISIKGSTSCFNLTDNKYSTIKTNNLLTKEKEEEKIISSLNTNLNTKGEHKLIIIKIIRF